jgi:hypothetical protein
MAGVNISYTSADGEEHEESWPSVERFRAWAAIQGTACTYTAYAEDEDGEWVMIDRGRVGAIRPGGR